MVNSSPRGKRLRGGAARPALLPLARRFRENRTVISSPSASRGGRAKGWPEQRPTGSGELSRLAPRCAVPNGRAVAEEGGRWEVCGEVRAREQPVHTKSFVPPLPVLSFLLLRGVHELICWQLQDKGFFDCKLKDLEKKSNRACHSFLSYVVM